MKEKCPKCGNESFAIARDMDATRHCGYCGHKWLPESFEPGSHLIAEAESKYFQEEVHKLKVELQKLEKQLALKTKVPEPPQGPESLPYRWTKCKVCTLETLTNCEHEICPRCYL